MNKHTVPCRWCGCPVEDEVSPTTKFNPLCSECDTEALLSVPASETKCTVCEGKGQVWYGISGFTAGGQVDKCSYCGGDGIEKPYQCTVCGQVLSSQDVLSLMVGFGIKCDCFILIGREEIGCEEDDIVAFRTFDGRPRRIDYTPPTIY